MLMPAKRRLTMRQIRQMLRLCADDVSVRDIAMMLGLARSTVQDNLERARAAGLSWPLPGELKKPAVTLQILWEEYRAIHPDGYG
jgi:DNA-binding MarR family transcriptional regulator